MVKTGGIKTQKPEKSMFRTNANNVLRQTTTAEIYSRFLVSGIRSK